MTNNLFVQISPNVEPVTEPISVGEGPFWHSQKQILYYVGITDASIHSYNTVTKEHHSVKIGNIVTEKCILNLLYTHIQFNPIYDL